MSILYQIITSTTVGAVFAIRGCRVELSVLSPVSSHPGLHLPAPLAPHLQVQLAPAVIAGLGAQLGTQDQYSQHTVIFVKVETAFVTVRIVTSDRRYSVNQYYLFVLT